MNEENEIEVVIGYEAGCLGFSLYHELAYYDVSCVILAPSTMHGLLKKKHQTADQCACIKTRVRTSGKK